MCEKIRAIKKNKIRAISTPQKGRYIARLPDPRESNKVIRLHMLLNRIRGVITSVIHNTMLLYVDRVILSL